MIYKNDLKVGLETECGKTITAIGKYSVLYESEHENGGTKESFESIDEFCELYSIKKKKLEIVRWANIYRGGEAFLYLNKDRAQSVARPEAIAIAVEMRGSYEI